MCNNAFSAHWIKDSILWRTCIPCQHQTISLCWGFDKPSFIIWVWKFLSNCMLYNCNAENEYEKIIWLSFFNKWGLALWSLWEHNEMWKFHTKYFQIGQSIDHNHLITRTYLLRNKNNFFDNTLCAFFHKSLVSWFSFHNFLSIPFQSTMIDFITSKVW